MIWGNTEPSFQYSLLVEGVETIFSKSSSSVCDRRAKPLVPKFRCTSEHGNDIVHAISDNRERVSDWSLVRIQLPEPIDK